MGGGLRAHGVDPAPGVAWSRSQPAHTFGGPGHGKATTPLHLAAQNGDLDAVRALLDLGADPALKDGLYDSTPAGWAEHGGRRAARDLLREHAE